MFGTKEQIQMVNMIHLACIEVQADHDLMTKLYACWMPSTKLYWWWWFSEETNNVKDEILYLTRFPFSVLITYLREIDQACFDHRKNALRMRIHVASRLYLLFPICFCFHFKIIPHEGNNNPLSHKLIIIYTSTKQAICTMLWFDSLTYELMMVPRDVY